MVSSQMALGVTGGLIGTGLSFWVWRRETIPYTRRRHVILISTQMERRIGNALFQQVC